MTGSSTNNLEYNLNQLISEVNNSNLSNGSKKFLVSNLNSFLAKTKNIEEILKSYEQDIDQCLLNSKKPPFSWNRDNCSEQEKQANFNRDRRQYLNLISYCIRFNSTYLLDQWGIKYPFSPGIRLAKSVTDYLIEFEKWKNNPQDLKELGINPQQTSIYIQRLIDEFKKKQTGS